jgi:NAD-dependent dihydropyrimidine dehydrogenase PreA subunit
MRRLLYLPGVVSLKHLAERCNGCGSCLEVCPHGVWEAQAGKVRIAERDACMECGACQRNCSHRAIQVQTGVGCASAVLNAALGRKSSACCCSVDSDTPGCC